MTEQDKKAAFNNEDCQSKIVLHAEKLYLQVRVLLSVKSLKIG